MRTLGLKSLKQWRTYSLSRKRPNDIPANPRNVYANAGWKGWGNFLGTGRLRNGDISWRSFEEAREYARKLELKSQKEWRAYSRSNRRPKDIPAAPDRTYSDAGWKGFADFLGAGQRIGGWRSFEDARAFARKLGFKSQKEWKALGQRPNDIPMAPKEVYADAGWKGWADFLGTGRRRPGDVWPSFKKARAFARTLRLGSETEWRAYCRSGKRPNDIPSKPDRIYTEWKGWGDFLGTGRRRLSDSWRSFEEAREYARKLELGSIKEWRVYSPSGKRPNDIPANPDTIYANSGWNGWSDFLGTGRRLDGRAGNSSKKRARSCVIFA